jgi:Hypothetical glycosyl hydrolase family 15
VKTGSMNDVISRAVLIAVGTLMGAALATSPILLYGGTVALYRGAATVSSRDATATAINTVGAGRTATAPDVPGLTGYASPILLYAQDWNGFSHSRSMTDWKFVAGTHPILVGAPGSDYKNIIPQLHIWNPILKALVYDLGPYTIKGTSEYQQLTVQHPDYFAHDAQGHLITVEAASGSPAFAKNTLMDEGNPGWGAWEGQRIAANIAKGGFDGAYVDSMGPGVFTGTTTAVPINRGARRPYTEVEWMQAGGRSMNAVRAAIGKKYLVSTGIVNGTEFLKYTHYLADSQVDGVQTDSWLRVANASPSKFPSAGALAADLAMVQLLQAKGKSFFGWTKVWIPASQAQTAAWNAYALSAYLLVDNVVNDFYTFNSPFHSDRTKIFFSNELAVLGSPLGPYTLVAGVYQRAFQHGTVTLNSLTAAGVITTH